MIHPRCPTLYFTQNENKNQTAAVSKSSDWFPNNEISVPRVGSVTVNETDEMVVDEVTCPVVDDGVAESRSQHFDLPAESSDPPVTLIVPNASTTVEVVEDSITPTCTPVHSEVSQNPVALEMIGNREPTSEKKMTAVLALPQGKRNESSIVSETSERKITAVLAPPPERKRNESSVASETASARESSLPPCKKLKSDLVDDEQVQSMLNDFVDILA